MAMQLETPQEEAGKIIGVLMAVRMHQDAEELLILERCGAYFGHFGKIAGSRISDRHLGRLENDSCLYISSQKQSYSGMPFVLYR